MHTVPFSQYIIIIIILNPLSPYQILQNTYLYILIMTVKEVKRETKLPYKNQVLLSNNSYKTLLVTIRMQWKLSEWTLS